MKWESETMIAIEEKEKSELMEELDHCDTLPSPEKFVFTEDVRFKRLHNKELQTDLSTAAQ